MNKLPCFVINHVWLFPCKNNYLVFLKNNCVLGFPQSTSLKLFMYFINLYKSTKDDLYICFFGSFTGISQNSKLSLLRKPGIFRSFITIIEILSYKIIALTSWFTRLEPKPLTLGYKLVCFAVDAFYISTHWDGLFGNVTLKDERIYGSSYFPKEHEVNNKNNHGSNS